VAVESIWTPVQEGDMACNHLLVSAREVPLGEMHDIAYLNYFSEKVGSRAKTLDDARNLLSARAGAPEIIGCGSFAGGFRIFNDSDLG